MATAVWQDFDYGLSQTGEFSLLDVVQVSETVRGAHTLTVSRSVNSIPFDWLSLWDRASLLETSLGAVSGPDSADWAALRQSMKGRLRVVDNAPRHRGRPRLK
jgi:hypothetical protein